MGEKLGKEDWVRLAMMVAGLLAAVTVAVPAALGAGTDPKASATFLDSDGVVESSLSWFRQRERKLP